jgi:translation initiation factor 3 subunit B
MTGVSWWGHKVDNAYWLWNFQGKILKRVAIPKFCQVSFSLFCRHYCRILDL